MFSNQILKAVQLTKPPHKLIDLANTNRRHVRGLAFRVKTDAEGEAVLEAGDAYSISAGRQARAFDY